MFLFENVKGMLSMKEQIPVLDENGNEQFDEDGKIKTEAGRFILEVIKDNFAHIDDETGYTLVGQDVLDAVNYGVPQHREDDPVSYILRDPINFNWAVKKLMLKILLDKNIIVLPSWEKLEWIFELRNDFAHNPIHLRDGNLVLSKNGQDVLYGKNDIAEIRTALALVEGELIAQYSRQAESDVEHIDIEKEFCTV